MAIDISNLLGKKDDNPTDAGRLTANDWNQLVSAVQENQDAVKGSIKGIRYNEHTLYNEIDKDGILKMIVGNDAGRKTEFELLKYPNPQDGSHYITPNDPCVVEFIVKDYKIVNGSEVPFNVPGKINYYVNNTLVHTQENVYSHGTIYYTGPISFDFSKYAKLGTSINGNTLKIEYINEGISPISEYFNVFVLDVSLVVSNVEKIYSTNKLQNIKYDIVGYQKYLMYATIDDNFVINGVECNSDVDYYLKGSDIALLNTHGAHILKMWAEIEIPNSTYRLATPAQEFTYIYGDVNNPTPVIICDVMSNSQFEIYSNLVINYFAYLANANSDKNISISIISDENSTLFNTIQKISFTGDTCSNTHTFSLFPEGRLTADDIIGAAKISLSIENNDPFEIPIEITPSSIQLIHETNYLTYLSSMGRNNNETDTLKKWESVSYDNSFTTTVDFDESIEFTDSGSGWIKDSDGNTAMHLRRGNGFTVNCQPFLDNPVYPNGNYGTGNGLTISVEFATRNCLNANAKVINCMDENGIGFYVTASSAHLCGSDVRLETEFREDTRIRLDIVIDDKLREYKYTSAEGKKGQLKEYTDKQSYAIMFVDGVYSGVSLIGQSTSFKQSIAKNIRFGSDDCDLDIYNIRIYRKTLSIKNIVDNYAYDTPAAAEKIAIAKRNLNILSENSSYPFMPNINVEPARMSNGVDGGLKVAKPELPLFYITMDKPYNNVLPNDKDNWSANALTQFVNPLVNDVNNIESAQCSFEVENGAFKNQGTSSMNYPWPWRNFDWKANTPFYMPNLNSSLSASKWFQYSYRLRDANNGSLNNTLAIKKITLKKDYASSEMCNNAITSDYFTQMALSIYKDYVGNSSASTTKFDYNPGVLSPAMYEDVLQNNITDYRLSLKALPCFCIQKLTETTDGSVSSSNSDTGTFAIGMMNLIPNKNEVGYLGFKSNKWEKPGESTLREQSWELTENKDDMYWVTPINYIHKDESGNYVSELDGNYEARTPKDSTLYNDTDFGIVDGNPVDEKQSLELYDQQKDIIDFHNWAVSVDRSGATNKEFTENNPYWQPEDWNINTETGEPLYTTDSKEYRLAKFAAEAEKHMIVDQWILYYIWREQFWMFDSGFKNLQVYTVGENPKYKNSGVMQWGCMVRDADTALGIQNVGKIVFPPYLEDIDYYVPNEVTGKYDFIFNGAKNVHGYKELKALNPQGEPVLNGQFGSLWLNIRDTYPKEIAAMYRRLYSSPESNFNAADAIKVFRDHQENWSESLYNFGLRQYIGGEMFTKNLDAACGDKKQSRAQWLDRGFYYRASKYRALGTDYLNMRGTKYETTVEEEQKRGDIVRVKTYIPMYVGLGGEGSTMLDSRNHLRIIDVDDKGNYYRDINIGAGGFEYAFSPDTNNYIFGASNITELGDLARYIKVKDFQNLSLPKLRRLELGHESKRDGITYYEIIEVNGEKIKQPISNILLTTKNLSFNKCPQLEILDLTNHQQLQGIQIDSCLQLKELYLRGTNMIQSVQFPKTSTLKTLYLGDKLTSLDLSDLSGVSTLVVDGLTECNQLVIRNSGSYIGSREISYKLMTDVINNPNLNKLILEDINWDFTKIKDNKTVEYLEKILELRKQFGRENISIKGKIYGLTGLTGALKIKLSDIVNGFGDIDNEDNDLYITYDQKPINSLTLPKKIYLHTPEVYNMAERLVINPVDANTYLRSEWTITENDFATITTDGKLTRNDIPCEEGTSGAIITATVYQMNDKDGSPRDPMPVECEVYFYERVAKPGDIVFNDGTYSDELEAGKTPIGVCFYVDPTNKENRLMCALENVRAGNYSSWSWGLHVGGSFDDYYYGADPNMSFDGGADPNNRDNKCYDIANIDNISSGDTGISNYNEFNNDTVFFIDDIYRDAANEANNYFKEFDKMTHFGDLGWKYADYNVKVYDITLSDGSTSLEIKNGDYIPSGYYNTLAIIAHRDRILSAYRNAEDDTFARPIGGGNYTDLTKLASLMSKAGSWEYASRNPNVADTRGDLLYYGAASACFAYEPTGVVNLNNKFKKYNWFLPASGDMIRILYYYYQSYDPKTGNVSVDAPINSNYDNSYKDPANAFAKAIADKKLSTSGLNGSMFATSTEIDINNTSTITSYYGRINTTSKSSENYVRPICRF